MSPSHYYYTTKEQMSHKTESTDISKLVLFQKKEPCLKWLTKENWIRGDGEGVILILLLGSVFIVKNGSREDITAHIKALNSRNSCPVFVPTNAQSALMTSRWPWEGQQGQGGVIPNHSTVAILSLTTSTSLLKKWQRLCQADCGILSGDVWNAFWGHWIGWSSIVQWSEQCQYC